MTTLHIWSPQETPLFLGALNALLVPSSQPWTNTSTPTCCALQWNKEGQSLWEGSLHKAWAVWVSGWFTHLCVHLCVQDRLCEQPTVQHSEHLEVQLSEVWAIALQLCQRIPCLSISSSLKKKLQACGLYRDNLQNSDGRQVPESRTEPLTVINFGINNPSLKACFCFYGIFPVLCSSQFPRAVHLPCPAQRAQYQAGSPQNCHLLENDLQSQLCCHQPSSSFLKQKSNFRIKGYTLLSTRQHLQPGQAGL